MNSVISERYPMDDGDLPNNNPPSPDEESRRKRKAVSVLPGEIPNLSTH
jgi:hypothetical protein